MASCIWRDGDAYWNWEQQWHLWIPGTVQWCCLLTASHLEYYQGSPWNKSAVGSLKPVWLPFKANYLIRLGDLWGELDRAFIVFHKPLSSDSIWGESNPFHNTLGTICRQLTTLLAWSWPPLPSKWQTMGMGNRQDSSVSVSLKISVMKGFLLLYNFQSALNRNFCKIKKWIMCLDTTAILNFCVSKLLISYFVGLSSVLRPHCSKPLWTPCAQWGDADNMDSGLPKKA